MIKDSKKKGVALILAVIVITMVSILLASYVAMVISERRRAEHQTATASAEYIAKVGLERAFFDLSSEYDKDRSWVNEDWIHINQTNGFRNIINNQNWDDVIDTGLYEGMSFRGDAASFGEDASRSNFLPFYDTTSFTDEGEYVVDIAFIIDSGASCPSVNPATCFFIENMLWVRSTGRVLDYQGNTMDEVTLIQLARVRRVKNETQTLFYDYVQPAETEASPNDDIRMTGFSLDEDIVINKSLWLRGGYGYDFSDGSRDTSANKSILQDNTGDPVIDITGGAGVTVTMGGVRIE